MANETEIKKESKAKALMIERSSFTAKDDGREMFSYLIKGKAYGRDIRVDLVPKDNGGYEVLDIMNSISPNKMELLMRDEEMKDDKTGKVSKYTVYEAVVTDKDGNVITCPMKMQRGSDKSLLNMLLITM